MRVLLGYHRRRTMQKSSRFKRQNGAGIIGIDHVDIRVSARPALARFLTQTLGLGVLGEGPDHTFLLFGDQVLGLRDLEGGQTPPTVDHVALRVENLSGVKQWLEGLGAKVTGEKARVESTSLFIEAPSGVRIELVHRPDPQALPVHPPIEPRTSRKSGSKRRGRARKRPLGR